MIIKGDKIKLVKKVGSFNKIGDIFEVTSVDDGVISFTCGYGTGCMSYAEFEKYFERCENHEGTKRKNKWTRWRITDPIEIEDIEGNKRWFCYSVRSNGKKVQVKKDNLRAEATCCKDDTFNFAIGMKLAEKRLIVKFLKQQVDELAKSM